MIGGFLWLMPEKLEGLVVGGSHEFEGMIYFVLLIVVDGELAVCYVLGHLLVLFC
jgi:hypothetical protein